jgi:hypothetical protein
MKLGEFTLAASQIILVEFLEGDSVESRTSLFQQLEISRAAHPSLPLNAG